MKRALIDGRAVAYDDRDGEGGSTPLVFLHMFGGSSRSWGAVLDRLAPGRRCIAVDIPGFGASDPVPPDVSVEGQAETIERLLDGLGVGRHGLVGHSMGGKLALIMAARRPERIASLALVAASPPGPEPGDDAERGRLLADHGDRPAMERLVTSLVERPLAPEMRSQLIDDHLRASQEGWRWWLERGAQEDLSVRAKDVRAPSLIVSGACDPVFPADVHDALALSVPRSQRARIAEAGHLLPLEAPEDIAALLSAHIPAAELARPR